MDIDPIVALESLGYTRREAAFLYLVAVHSGYFLRRQFDYFIDRQKGAIAQNFLQKARVAGQIEIIDYGQGRHLYHLFAKTIYRLIGNPESQNRRRKGDGLIRSRLLTLDYVLENDSDYYLESDDEKIRFFTDLRSLPKSLCTDISGRLLPLLSSCAISVTDRAYPATAMVRLLFADEALLTAEKFTRFLSVCEALLSGLRRFEVVYASHSAHNFVVAEKEFRARFAVQQSNAQAVLGDWSEPPRVNHAPIQAKFTTILFRYSYPNLRRSESRSLSTVRVAGLSADPQIDVSQQDHVQRGPNVG